MSLAELFPAEAAMGAALPDAAGQDSAIAAGQVSEAGADSANPLPILAGIIVTLAILFGGGGLLWWRNRDTNYWPA
jgi:hypothetical protein